MLGNARQLTDLYSVGPATIKDLHLLGISSVRQLKNKRSEKLYRDLCRATKFQHDPCVIDVFRAAIEQAKNPALEPEKCRWWYWTQVRKLESK